MNNKANRNPQPCVYMHEGGIEYFDIEEDYPMDGICSETRENPPIRREETSRLENLE